MVNSCDRSWLAGGFDRIHVTDHVRDRDVWRGEFFDVTLLGSQVGDGRVVTLFLDQFRAA